jgi:hypothetical protein
MKSATMLQRQILECYLWKESLLSLRIVQNQQIQSATRMLFSNIKEGGT